jgi:hypothetical protein
MNDPRHSCELHSEAISLLAAECLSGQAESELREHLALCATCRQRYQEFVRVCSEVRTAKPVVEPKSALAIERCLRNLPTPTRDVGRQNRTAQRRVAMLAASVLVLVGVLSPLAFQRSNPKPEKPTEVVRIAPPLVLREPSDLRLPTMLSLRRAAAESDESFCQLLARYSDPMLLEPLGSHTFSRPSFGQESLR